MNIIQQLISEISALPTIDWIITLTAIIYLLLATRNNVWCWFWGIISCSIWAYSSFVNFQLYLDAALQLFYVVMGFVGIYQWKYGNSKEELPISKLSRKDHLLWLSIGSVVAVLFGYFFAKLTPAAATYLDAFTTIFSIIATFFLVRRKLDNWMYWVIIDAVYVYLYASRGAFLFALLMVWYVYLAAKAYFNWKTEWQTKSGHL